MQGTMLQRASIRREGELEALSLHIPEVQQCAFTHPVAKHTLTGCLY